MKLHPANADWTEFSFSDENVKRAKKYIARYPAGRQQSAVLPLLNLAQRQCDGWLPNAAVEHVAKFLDMPKIRVLEVATFYSMLNQAPVGKNFIQLCRTTPCWLRGSDDLREVCKREAGCGLGETSADGLFTVVEVECLGACCNAPMVQINDDYYEDLTPENFAAVIQVLKRGETPKPGSQTGRVGSAPAGGPTTLTADTGAD